MPFHFLQKNPQILLYFRPDLRETSLNMKQHYGKSGGNPIIINKFTVDQGFLFRDKLALPKRFPDLFYL